MIYVNFFDKKITKLTQKWVLTCILNIGHRIHLPPSKVTFCVMTLFLIATYCSGTPAEKCKLI